MVALHDLGVKAAVILNTYIMAPNREKICIVLGLEFGDDAGKSSMIVRLLDGLKCALSTSCTMHARMWVLVLFY